MSVLLLAGLPLLLVWRAPIRYTPWWPQLGRNLSMIIASALLLGALLFALFADLSATMRNHGSVRYLINPLNSLYALIDLGVQSRARPAARRRRSAWTRASCRGHRVRWRRCWCSSSARPRVRIISRSMAMHVRPIRSSRRWASRS